MYIAAASEWDFMPALWVYWAQSLIIGCAAALRLLAAGRFTCNGRPSGEMGAGERLAKKISRALFLLFSYGFFHAVYLAFMIGFLDTSKGGDAEEMLEVLIGIAIFAAHHLFDTVREILKGGEAVDINYEMLRPFVRIIPVHITVLAGAAALWFAGPSAGTGLLLLFMGLKTFVEFLVMMRGGRPVRVETNF